MSEPQTEKYSFEFDKAKNTWICSVHGETDCTAWVPAGMDARTAILMPTKTIRLTTTRAI